MSPPVQPRLDYCSVEQVKNGKGITYPYPAFVGNHPPEGRPRVTAYIEPWYAPYTLRCVVSGGDVEKVVFEMDDGTTHTERVSPYYIAGDYEGWVNTSPFLSDTVGWHDVVVKVFANGTLVDTGSFTISIFCGDHYNVDAAGQCTPLHCKAREVVEDGKCRPCKEGEVLLRSRLCGN